MSEPMMGSIQMFAFTSLPRGWAYCDGRLLNIQSFHSLFTLVGDQYGGDGRVAFGLPDFRGRAPVGAGQAPGMQDYPVGSKTGREFVRDVPRHSHALTGGKVFCSAGTYLRESKIESTATAYANGQTFATYQPSGNYPGTNTSYDVYASESNTTMHPDFITVESKLTELELQTDVAAYFEPPGVEPAGQHSELDIRQPVQTIGNFGINFNGRYPVWASESEDTLAPTPD